LSQQFVNIYFLEISEDKLQPKKITHSKQAVKTNLR